MSVRGLEGVTAGTTELSSIIEGVLRYRGINIDDLAAHSNYEEIVYLLFYGSLPTRSELDAFSKRLWSNRALPDGVQRLLKEAPRNAVPMDVLRTAVSALGFYEEKPSDTSSEVSLDKAIRLVAKMPTIVTSIERNRRGQPLMEPPADVDTAHAFLYMLYGREPNADEAEAMRQILILHADHEFNASTFTARVAAATLADLHAAITAALAALKGPLHGGANMAVMMALSEIGNVEGVEPYVMDKLARHEVIMGFGHRVYKNGDPRAKWLRAMSEKLSKQANDPEFYDMSVKMDEIMTREKGLLPNVDFYAATVYHFLGIPTDLMTPVFATSRTAGWSAHVMEQYANNRLIRPRADYVGVAEAPYVPIDQRG